MPSNTYAILHIPDTIADKASATEICQIHCIKCLMARPDGNRDQKHNLPHSTWFTLYLDSLRRQKEYTLQAQSLRQELIATQQEKLDQLCQRNRDITMSGKHTMGKTLVPRILREQFEAAMNSMRLTSRLKNSANGTFLETQDVKNSDRITSDKRTPEQNNQQRFSKKNNETVEQGLLVPPLEYPKFSFELNENTIKPSVSPTPVLSKRQKFSAVSKNEIHQSLPVDSVSQNHNRVPRYRLSKDSSNECSQSLPNDIHGTFPKDTKINKQVNFLTLHDHRDIIEVPYDTLSRSNGTITRLPAIHPGGLSTSGLKVPLGGHTRHPKNGRNRNTSSKADLLTDTIVQDESEFKISNDDGEHVNKRKRKTVRFAEDLVTDIPVFVKKTSSSLPGIEKSKMQNSNKNGNTITEQERRKFVQSLDDNENNVDAEFEELGRKYAEKMRRRASYKNKQRRSLQLTSPPKLNNLPLTVVAALEQNGGETSGISMAISDTQESESGLPFLPHINTNDVRYTADSIASPEIAGVSTLEESARKRSGSIGAAMPFFPPIVEKDKHYQPFGRINDDK